ncbi:MAG: hypothetical protein WCL34_16140 [Methylococcaceae bacterium]
MPLISIIAYVCAKYISAKWLGIWKCFFGYFAAFLLSWLGGGMLAMFLYDSALEGIAGYDAKNEFLKVFAQGFWWAFIGLLFGIYKGKKARNSEISKVQ